MVHHSFSPLLSGAFVALQSFFPREFFIDEAHQQACRSASAILLMRFDSFAHALQQQNFGRQKK